MTGSLRTAALTLITVVATIWLPPVHGAHCTHHGTHVSPLPWLQGRPARQPVALQEISTPATTGWTPLGSRALRWRQEVDNATAPAARSALLSHARPERKSLSART